MTHSSDSEIFMGIGHERQEWPLLETAQVWTDNLQELKRRGVMTTLDLRNLETKYGKWATHLAISYGEPIRLARLGDIKASKQEIINRADRLSSKRHLIH